MFDQLTTYFKAEKSEALIFMIAGLVAAAFAVYAFTALKQRFYTGIAVPLLLIGLIQFVVGSTVYFRTDKQVAQLETVYRESPAKLAAGEVPRIEGVLKSFTIIKYTEIVFILSGILLLLFLRSNDLWFGIGLGLLAQGTLSLILDIFAERRAAVYLEHLQNLAS